MDVRSYLKFILVFTVVLVPASSAYAQSKQKKSKSPVYVVSNDELKAYSNTADLLKEIEMLREHRDSLLDYSKKMKVRARKLEDALRKKGRVSISTTSRSHDQGMKTHREEVEKLQQEKKNIETEYEALKIRYEAIKADSDNLKSRIVMLEQESKVQSQTQEAKNLEVGSELSAMQAQLSDKTESEAACMAQLEESQKLVMKIPDLEAELLTLRSDKLLRTTAAELLGHDLKALKESDKTKVAKRTEVVTQKKSTPGIGSDILVVEVTGDRVALRAGPGTNHSSLMDVSRGARLTVESKEGVWYRVNSPTGGRAFIHSDYAKAIGGKPSTSKIIPEVASIRPPLPAQPVRNVGRARLGKGQSPSQVKDNTHAGQKTETLESLALKQLRRGIDASKNQ